MTEIDLDASIYDLTEAHPELIDVLDNMGFFSVTRPAVRNALGRVTTLAEGCERQGNDLDQVIAVLKVHGFSIKE